MQTVSPAPKDFPIPPTRASRVSYSACSKAWGYLDKVTTLGRHTINTLGNNLRLGLLIGKDSSKHITTIGVRLDFISAVGLPFALFSLQDFGRKIINSFGLSDKEGLALNSLYLSATLLGIFETVATTINTGLTLASKAPIALFSTLGLPIGFAVYGLNFISASINTVKAVCFYRKVNRELLEGKKFENKTDLKNFIDQTIGITQKELDVITSQNLNGEEKEAKITYLRDQRMASVLRSAPKDSVDELNSLFEMLKTHKGETFSTSESLQIANSLEKAQSHLRKKITLDSLSVVINLISIVGLTLFLASNVAWLPFIVLGTACVIRLGVFIYRDLHNPVSTDVKEPPPTTNAKPEPTKA